MFNNTRMRKYTAYFLTLLMIASIVMPTAESIYAEQLPQPTYGQLLDERKMELAPGAVYTWNDMKLDRGYEKLHYVEFNPLTNPHLELQPAMTDGKVLGMQTLSGMTAIADAPGNRVVAAINGDYYDMSNGVPLGMFMGDNEILTSPVSDWHSFGIKNDGTAIYGVGPTMTRTLNINGKNVPISHINRTRAGGDNGALILYTEMFHTSTATNEIGDEIVLDIIEGEVKSGQTMKLRVSEIRNNLGDTPLVAGKVVLSASGKHRAELAGLKVGDEITASFELTEQWKDVKMAIGGSRMLVVDGKPLTHADDTSLSPRVAIGNKADGTIVMLQIDGRSPGFSEGVNYDELSIMLANMGVVNAINLDGGGSATFVAKLPGETDRKVLNKPSDGNERKTANGILLVNKAPELNTASKLAILPVKERVLVNSTVSFKAGGLDQNGHPAAISGTPTWSVGSELGSFAENGSFTAGSKVGMATVTAELDGLTGTSQVEVVDQLTELVMPDKIRTFSSGQVVPLTVKALNNGQVIKAANDSFEWQVDGPIGTINENGEFTASQGTGLSGTITVKYGNIETSMQVTVGQQPVMLEDFEGNLDRYHESAGARFNYVKASIETNEDYVRSGKQALKLEYDFIGWPSTSGAYLQVKDADSRIDIPGYPEKIGMWVYGDGKKHWLRAQLIDKKGAVGIDFVGETVGVDFEGWRYLEADVPKGREAPFKLDMPVRYMETKATNKNDGVIYVDDIRALYGPATEDLTPPVIKNISPAESAVVRTSTPKIQAYGEAAGYDPILNPGTTLIDPDKIRLYVDDVLVKHTLYPPVGQIHYTPTVPLADGVHKAKLKIRDLTGNRTEKEWYFTVDTDSSKIVYNHPAEVYAGNAYTLDIKAEKAALITNGHIEFKLDPTRMTNIEVIPGSKLEASQLTPSIDAATGIVRIAFNNLAAASLSDNDLVAQIRYEVKPEAAEQIHIQFLSGAIQFKDTGHTNFGFYGLPIKAPIKHHLNLSWDEFGVVEGNQTVFTVKDEQGNPVEGAIIRHQNGADIGVTDNSGQLKTNAVTGTVQEYSLQAVKQSMFSPVAKFKVSKLAGSSTPHNVSVTMWDDTKTSKAFNWHTNPGTEPTIVEVVKQADFTDFNASNVLRFEGRSHLFTMDTGTVRVHKAEATGLEPDTKYVFRVGDGSSFSEQGTFQTASDKENRTKFLFMGDSQATNEKDFKLWGDTLKKAMLEQPDTEFVVHGGDLVEDGYKQNEWNMWFNAANGELMNTTIVPVVGNHEVTGARQTADYLAHFNHPQNGIDSLKGSNFSFDYNNAHFVVLNSESDFEAQKEWLRNDLKNTDKMWKFVAFHRGPYGSQYDSEHIRKVWTPIFDEFQVDVVMNGHDHVYVRTWPMKDMKPVKDGQGTVYIVGGSTGPKFYPVIDREWQRVTDGEKTQIYVAAEIIDNEVKFVVKTIGGRVVDEFSLLKILPESVTLDQTEANLAVGESVKLEATVLPKTATNKSVTWSVYSSTAPDTVAVSKDGIVTAQNLGTATIRATSVTSSVYADSVITVDRLSNIQIDEVRLSEASGTLNVGEQFQLEATVYPEQAANHSVLWSSSNEDVALVSDTGLIKALKPGTATIRAMSAADNTKYAEFTLTVEQPTSLVDEVRVSKNAESMTAGDKLQLRAVVLPETVSNKEVSWSIASSSSTDAIRLSDTGLVEALKAGEAVVRATSVLDPSKYAEVYINVSSSNSGGGEIIDPQPEIQEPQPENGLLTLKPQLTANSTNATASLSEKQLADLKEQAKADAKGVKTLQVKLEAIPNAQGYKVTLPKSAWISSD